jgi:hypothetical protein
MFKWLYESFKYYANFLNFFYYKKSYINRLNKQKKIQQLDLDSLNKLEKEKIIQDKQQETKKLKLEKEKINLQKKKTIFISNLKTEMDKQLNITIENWIDNFGIYSYKCVDGLQANIKISDPLLSTEKISYRPSDIKVDDYLFDSYNNYNERNKLRHNLFNFEIKSNDAVLSNMFKKLPYLINDSDKKKANYTEVLNVFKNILILKTKINIEKKKKFVLKKNFLARVLRVLLYVEDRDAEMLNEQLAKAFFYTRDVNYNFRVRSSNIKVRSLEWTIPSPPPLHTFYVPVRTIVTNDRFYNYKKGKRLLQNENYNFKETPSIFQKGMRKITKTFFLFINYITYVLGINKFDTDVNGWYKGSYNVEESEEYSHSVEYVSQSIRYPHKYLSKHLPFSAGLHNNTISIDLLVTPDKSNTVLFGENKNYLTKPSFLNKKSIVKPLFILGDRNSYLSKIELEKIDINYKNYLSILLNIKNELLFKGDGVYLNYYLPNLKTNSINLFFWSNYNLEDSSKNNYFYTTRGNFFNINDKFNSIDLTCLHLDINNKNVNFVKNMPHVVKNKLISILNMHSSFKEKYYNIYNGWSDVQDLNWSLEFIYTNFYIPYKTSQQLKKTSFFYRYLITNYLVLPILGKGWYDIIKADITFIKHITTFFKK